MEILVALLLKSKNGRENILGVLQKKEMGVKIKTCWVKIQIFRLVLMKLFRKNKKKYKIKNLLIEKLIQKK